MKPIQHSSNNDVLAAPRGASTDECRALAITRVKYGDDIPGIWSFWQPTDVERQLIAAGASIRLSVIGLTHPPVHVGVDGDAL